MTNFYEKGDKPPEIVTSRQWYLKNAGTDAKLNAELIERGKELDSTPTSCACVMRTGCTA